MLRLLKTQFSINNHNAQHASIQVFWLRLLYTNPFLIGWQTDKRRDYACAVDVMGRHKLPSQRTIKLFFCGIEHIHGCGWGEVRIISSARFPRSNVLIIVLYFWKFNDCEFHGYERGSLCVHWTILNSVSSFRT